MPLFDRSWHLSRKIATKEGDSWQSMHMQNTIQRMRAKCMKKEQQKKKERKRKHELLFLQPVYSLLKYQDL